MPNGSSQPLANNMVQQQLPLMYEQYSPFLQSYYSYPQGTYQTQQPQQQHLKQQQFYIQQSPIYPPSVQQQQQQQQHPLSPPEQILEQLRHYLAQDNSLHKDHATVVEVDQALQILRENLSHNTSAPTIGSNLPPVVHVPKKEDIHNDSGSEVSKEPSVRIISSARGRAVLKSGSQRPVEEKSLANRNNVGMVEVYLDNQQVKRICGFNVMELLARKITVRRTPVTIKKENGRTKSKSISSLPPPYLCRLDEVAVWEPTFLKNAELHQESLRALDFVVGRKKMTAIRGSKTTPKPRRINVPYSHTNRPPIGNHTTTTTPQTIHTIHRAQHDILPTTAPPQQQYSYPLPQQPRPPSSIGNLSQQSGIPIYSQGPPPLPVLSQPQQQNEPQPIYLPRSYQATAATLTSPPSAHNRLPTKPDVSDDESTDIDDAGLRPSFRRRRRIKKKKSATSAKRSNPQLQQLSAPPLPLQPQQQQQVLVPPPARMPEMMILRTPSHLSRTGKDPPGEDGSRLLKEQKQQLRQQQLEESARLQAQQQQQHQHMLNMQRQWQQDMLERQNQQHLRVQQSRDRQEQLQHGIPLGSPTNSSKPLIPSTKQFLQLQQQPVEETIKTLQLDQQHVAVLNTDEILEENHDESLARIQAALPSSVQGLKKKSDDEISKHSNRNLGPKNGFRDQTSPPKPLEDRKSKIMLKEPSLVSSTRKFRGKPKYASSQRPSSAPSSRKVRGRPRNESSRENRQESGILSALASPVSLQKKKAYVDDDIDFGSDDDNQTHNLTEKQKPKHGQTPHRIQRSLKDNVSEEFPKQPVRVKSENRSHRAMRTVGERQAESERKISADESLLKAMAAPKARNEADENEMSIDSGSDFDMDSDDWSHSQASPSAATSDKRSMTTSSPKKTPPRNQQAAVASFVHLPGKKMLAKEGESSANPKQKADRDEKLLKVMASGPPFLPVQNATIHKYDAGSDFDIDSSVGSFSSSGDLHLDAPQETCIACGMQTELFLGDLKRCPRCSEVLYCSKECMQWHWEREHKNVCNGLTPSERQRMTRPVAHFGNFDSDTSIDPFPDSESESNKVHHYQENHLAASPETQNQSAGNLPHAEKCAACDLEKEFIPEGMISCPNCQKLAYCSFDCQEWHWASVHKSVCPGMMQHGKHQQTFKVQRRDSEESIEAFDKYIASSPDIPGRDGLIAAKAASRNTKSKPSISHHDKCISCNMDKEFIPEGMITCPKCLNLSYCSSDCQEWHWASGHREVCSGLSMKERMEFAEKIAAKRRLSEESVDVFEQTSTPFAPRENTVTALEASTRALSSPQQHSKVFYSGGKKKKDKILEMMAATSASKANASIVDDESIDTNSDFDDASAAFLKNGIGFVHGNHEALPPQAAPSYSARSRQSYACKQILFASSSAKKSHEEDILQLMATPKQSQMQMVVASFSDNDLDIDSYFEESSSSSNDAVETENTNANILNDHSDFEVGSFDETDSKHAKNNTRNANDNILCVIAAPRKQQTPKAGDDLSIDSESDLELDSSVSEEEKAYIRLDAENMEQFHTLVPADSPASKRKKPYHTAKKQQFTSQQDKDKHDDCVLKAMAVSAKPKMTFLDLDDDSDFAVSSLDESASGYNAHADEADHKQASSAELHPSWNTWASDSLALDGNAVINSKKDRHTHATNPKLTAFFSCGGEETRVGLATHSGYDPVEDTDHSTSSYGMGPPPPMPVSKANLDITSFGVPLLAKPAAIHAKGGSESYLPLDSRPSANGLVPQPTEHSAFSGVMSSNSQHAWASFGDSFPKPTENDWWKANPANPLNMQSSEKGISSTEKAIGDFSSATKPNTGIRTEATRTGAALAPPLEPPSAQRQAPSASPGLVMTKLNLQQTSGKSALDNTDDGSFSSDEEISPVTTPKPKARLNLKVTRLGGGSPTIRVSNKSSAADGSGQRSPAAPISNNYAGHLKTFSVTHRDDEIPVKAVPIASPSPEKSKVSSSSTGQTLLVSTQLNLKTKSLKASSPLSPSHSKSADEGSRSSSNLDEGSLFSRRDSVASDGESLISHSLSSSDDDADTSPSPPRKTRLNLKISRVGGPPEVASSPLPAPAESPPIRRLNLSICRVGGPTEAIASPPGPIESSFETNRMSFNVAELLGSAGSAPTSPDQAKSELDIGGDAVFSPGSGKRVSSKAKTHLRRLISHRTEQVGKGGTISAVSGHSEDMSLDPSLSDIFARKLMTEVGNSFVSEKKVREGFEDYEAAHKALVNFVSFKEQPGLKQATLTLITTVLLSDAESEKLGEIFHAIDHDEDGKLSRDDLRYGFQEFGGEICIDESKLRKLFWRIGRHAEDVAGFVGYTEFLIGAADKSNMMGSEALQQAFSVLDTDKNGFISADDLKQVLPSHDGMIEKIIAKVDIDGDGMISFGEFLSMVFKCGTADTRAKEREWKKHLSKSPGQPRLVPKTNKPEREWKYKKNPNLVTPLTADDLSPSKKQLPKNVLGELKGKIPHMEGLIDDDDDADDDIALGAAQESDSGDDREMMPVPLPGNVMSQLKAAQSDLKCNLNHVSAEELARQQMHYKDVEVPFLNELKEAQSRLGTYLNVVPDELKDRPQIADRPYITELKKAQATVLKDWREETYMYWL